MAVYPFTLTTSTALEPAGFNDGEIVIQRGCDIVDVTFDGPALIERHAIIKRSRLGRYFVGGPFLQCFDAEVGPFVSTGANVSINAGRHPKDWLSTHLFHCNPNAWAHVPEYAREMASSVASYAWKGRGIVGADVWLGSNALVLPDVAVAHGAIVGANCVVQRQVEPFEIVVGVPLRRAGWRFEASIRDRLLISRWWDRPLAELAHLDFTDIEACLDALEGQPS